MGDIAAGLTEAQAAEVVNALEVSGDHEDAKQQIHALYKLFLEKDCTIVEVNPLAEDTDGNLVAADAKLGFDDNAAYRQKELFAMKDDAQADPREVEAAKWDLNYIGLDGGGSARKEQIVAAFQILTADPHVKALLVNIFGGIMKCDVIAAGIVEAARELDLKVPLVVRLEGTNVEEGKRIMADSGLPIISADDLDDAAKKAVAALA